MDTSEDTSVLKLPSDLTFTKAVACVAAFKKDLRVPKHGGLLQIVLDASAVKQFDSSALAVLMQLRRDVIILGGQGVVLESMPAKLRELSELYGVSALFPDAV